ncbi:hypothetical protein ACLB2K_033262 [Fragaria x ananassa]
MANIPLLLLLLCSLAYNAPTLEAAYSPSYSYNPKPTAKNVVDSCWRSNPNWARNRQALANCAVGFGKDAIGGKYGRIYVVTTSSDDPINPKPGTLRYGVIQTQPLWIIFAKDMVIALKNELIMNSFKTIDGRGAKVEIAYGPCITVQGVSHVIIHGISIHDCKPGKSSMVRTSIWPGKSSTVTNNYFSQHDKVMLLGHNDKFTADKIMKVTIAFNRFGAGLIERMPRVRFGYAHVANNRYDEWKMYAIGGSANPTIFSEGNYFIAPTNPDAKQVTKREAYGGWKNWKWRSSNDVLQNGAYFIQSGWGSCYPMYTRTQKFKVSPGSMVPALTSNAGPLRCIVGKAC